MIPAAPTRMLLVIVSRCAIRISGALHASELMLWCSDIQ
jgi:hypothetical protein